MELLGFILFFVILRKFLSFDTNSQLFGYFLMLLTQFIGLFLPVYISKKLKKEPFLTKNDFKIKPTFILGGFVTGFSLQFLASLVNMPYLFILEKFGFSFSSNVNLPENNEFFLPYVIISCIIPAFFEEIFFRKYAYDYFKKHSPWLAVFASTVLFAVLHFDVTLFMCVFLLGAILALFIKNGSPLIFTMIVHFANNLAGFLLQTANEKTLYFLNKYFFLFALFSAVFVVYMLKKQTETKGDAK